MVKPYLKPKAVKRTTLRNKLDKIVREIVLKRDGATCVVCGSKIVPQAGHLFSRVSYSTRWDLNNVFCQCRNCNFRHEKDPWPFFNWYIKTFGQESLDQLDKRYRTVHKFTNQDLIDLYEEFEKILETYD